MATRFCRLTMNTVAPRRGGVDARLIRRREATLLRADGVVSSAKSFRPEIFAELTTPSAP